LAFFNVLVWHEKMMFGMYVIVWQFWAFFEGVGMKKPCMAFFKTFGSFTAVGLEFYNFFSGQRSSSFLPRSHPPRYKRLCRLRGVTGKET